MFSQWLLASVRAQLNWTRQWILSRSAFGTAIHFCFWPCYRLTATETEAETAATAMKIIAVQIFF